MPAFEVPAWGEVTTKASLETSETIFSVASALNVCGYDQDLGSSEPARLEVRKEIVAVTNASVEASRAREAICRFYREHQAADSAAPAFSPYASLALYLGEPPKFEITTRESDVPPDASRVLGFIPLLLTFYPAAGLHDIWLKHKAQYEAYVAALHGPLADMILKTDLYLKNPISGYLGRRFVVYVEPMAAPGQVNARNYGDDYFLIISPSPAGVKTDALRHTYLHFILDPLALKRANAITRLEAILYEVKGAPMDQSFKNDAALLVTESLVRAIEAHTLPGGGERGEAAVSEAMRQGYVLTYYFFNALKEFEKSPVSLDLAYGEMLRNIDVGRERKRAAATLFSAQATPEIVRSSRRRRESVLEIAEQRLSEGDVASARRMAQQVLDDHSEDAARATFMLARAATRNRDMAAAQNYFQRTLEIAREPRIVAWAHIYLGRIFDIKENREEALAHYRAALSAGDITPDTTAAAERGIQQAYTPPSPPKN